MQDAGEHDGDRRHEGDHGDQGRDVLREGLLGRVEPPPLATLARAFERAKMHFSAGRDTMAGFNIGRSGRGLPLLVIDVDEDEPVMVELEPQAARDMINKLAIVLADLGDVDHAYRPAAAGQSVEKPPLSPTGFPDIMVNEATGAVGMVSAHQWLGRVGLLIRRADFPAFADGLAELRDRIVGRKT